jgi:NRPS condensation-like uncharacterized protein
MTRRSHPMARRRHAQARERFSVPDQVSCYFDTVAEPANVHLEICLRGRLDPQVFRDAAVGALIASPRASSRRARFSALSSSFRWEHPARLETDPVSFTAFTDLAELAAKRNAFLARSPSIDTSPAALLLVASGPQSDCVILNAHHATMDGVSWLELLREIGRNYRAELVSEADGAGHEGGAGNEVHDWNAAGGGQRTPAGIRNAPDLTSPVPSTAPARRAAWHSLGSRPARIAAEHGGQRGCGLHLLLMNDTPVAPDGLEFKATVNDMLIAALILAVSRWNAEHGKPARPVRVTMPINARPADQQQAPGNHSRIVAVQVTAPAPADETPFLLMEVARQTKTARQTRGPQVGIATRALATAPCPTWLKRWLVRAALRLAGPALCDTAMLTNLGNIPDPPDFGLSGTPTMAFSVAAQMPRGISIAAITAGGRMQIGLRYNRALLDETAAARFAAGYQRALADITRSPAASQPGVTGLGHFSRQPAAGSAP